MEANELLRKAAALISDPRIANGLRDLARRLSPPPKAGCLTRLEVARRIRTGRGQTSPRWIEEVAQEVEADDGLGFVAEFFGGTVKTDGATRWVSIPYDGATDQEVRVTEEGFALYPTPDSQEPETAIWIA